MFQTTTLLSTDRHISSTNNKTASKRSNKNVFGIEHESNVLKETSNILIRNALMTSPRQNIDPYILFSCDTVPLSSVKVLLEGQLYIDASHRQKKINRASGKKRNNTKKVGALDKHKHIQHPANVIKGEFWVFHNVLDPI